MGSCFTVLADQFTEKQMVDKCFRRAQKVSRSINRRMRASVMTVQVYRRKLGRCIALSGKYDYRYGYKKTLDELETVVENQSSL